jgi:hypothetical protein
MEDVSSEEYLIEIINLYDAIDPATTEELAIKFNIPIKLSSENISIIRSNDNGTEDLSQTISASSKL